MPDSDGQLVEMSPEKVAARLDNRPGLRLAHYQRAALPVNAIYCRATVMARKPLTTIEEFSLRAIKRGIHHLTSLAGFLGLEENTLKNTVASLLQQELITYGCLSGSNERLLGLSPKGEVALGDLAQRLPIEREITIYYDRILGEVIPYDQIQEMKLYKPKQLQDLDWLELPAVPSRRVEPEDLQLSDIRRLGEEGSFRSRRSYTQDPDTEVYQIIGIRRIEMRSTLFREGLAAVFTSGKADEIQLGIAVDGKHSEAHEKRLSGARIIEKLGLPNMIQANTAFRLASDTFGPEVARVAESNERDVEAVSARMSTIEGAIELLEKRETECEAREPVKIDSETEALEEGSDLAAPSPHPRGTKERIKRRKRERKKVRQREGVAAGSESPLDAGGPGEQRPSWTVQNRELEEIRVEMRRLREEKAELRVRLNQVEVRYLKTYEHVEMRDKALREARERLLIISPWISGGVVKRSFLQELENRLTAGTLVCIGYGIKPHPGEREKNDQSAVRALEELANRYENLEFARLPNTHSKILVKDSEFSITTSFNWLSFSGDRRRTFRDETGTLVRDPKKVAELFEQKRAEIRDALEGG